MLRRWSHGIAAGTAVAAAVGLASFSCGDESHFDDGPPQTYLGEARGSGPALARPEGGETPGPNEGYDPLARARETEDVVANLEAAIPGLCYTQTGGDSNPCWVCHTRGQKPVEWADFDLQMEYAFSDVGLENHWLNLFEDRSDAVAAISDEEILEYIRVDNYTPLLEHLQDRSDYVGYVPDLDLRAGFDEEGFARDGSGWRAIRYKPFPGSFWPTNGSTDDVFIRLPPEFRESRALYKVNLAILEAAVTVDPNASNHYDAVREVEPVSELAAGFDLDGDGVLEAEVTEIHGLPGHYAGGAARWPVVRNSYPRNTEYLHSVRYVDPDAPSLVATRMKELRYSRNVLALDEWARFHRYETEANDRELGMLPQYRGSGLTGMRGINEWKLQGFIEDEDGWLRVQTDEETRFCMGCHGAIGIVVDGTFTMPRKLPGAAGWGYQDIRGIRDTPQMGHDRPEILTYFERVRGADEIRANTEMLERFFDADGNPIEAEVLRAAPGGDRDLAWLLAPSRERALLLDKAYRAIVMDQDFVNGRDATVTPVARVHREIEGNGSTELGDTDHVFRDGVLQLDWGWRPD